MENMEISDILTLINIVITAVAMVIVGVITYRAATDVYRNQKKDQNSSYQDYLHMILRETGQEYLKIKEVAHKIDEFGRELSNCHNVISAIRFVNELSVGVKKINPNPPFKNFDTYNYIFAKEEEICFRTKESCNLEKLEKDLEILHSYIKELCKKIDNLYKTMKNYGRIFQPPNKVKEVIEKIDNGELSVSQINDKDVEGICLVYDKNQEMKSMIHDIVTSFAKLERLLEHSQSITISVRKKYFYDTKEN